ncbi:hypothetical protein Gogos_001081 [Gossypium gossypioides]|uniref:Uncharacterized protein n=1 Tax=Gossypium gossypioides TaxID=34282 RepID=A0A7J9CUR1_GOSGO|nr:hypothetical protein [Gossypium gossypioides]
MKRVLFRGISLTTRNFLHSYSKTQFTRSPHSPLQLGLDSGSTHTNRILPLKRSLTLL